MDLLCGHKFWRIVQVTSLFLVILFTGTANGYAQEQAGQKREFGKVQLNQNIDFEKLKKDVSAIEEKLNALGDNIDKTTALKPEVLSNQFTEWLESVVALIDLLDSDRSHMRKIKQSIVWAEEQKAYVENSNLERKDELSEAWGTYTNNYRENMQQLEAKASATLELIKRLERKEDVLWQLMLLEKADELDKQMKEVNTELQSFIGSVMEAVTAVESASQKNPKAVPVGQ